ncbi:TPA: peroxide stress protein YaaA [Streptococcus pneumoniae]
MKILIPTAKEMNTDLPSIETTLLRSESQAVLDALALYSASQLESFYKVSAEKAAEECQNIQALKRQTAQHYPALKLFDGLMYRHIKRDKLTEVEQAYLENHVFITSALYGVVPALSPMAPHRLDFLMKLKVAGKTLKSHWKAAYDEAVKQEEVIFSLLSSEFETVFSKEIRAKMVTFKFMEDRGGQLKIHSTISKKARGAFLIALIENQVQTVGEARRLNFAGFVYREDLSQPQGLVFVKEV